MADIISPDSVETLKSTLINLIAGQAVFISDRDFKKLAGDDIAEFGSEGRLMMGNLAALANCKIDTTTGKAIFTKNQSPPMAGAWHAIAHEAHLIDPC